MDRAGLIFATLGLLALLAVIGALTLGGDETTLTPVTTGGGGDDSPVPADPPPVSPPAPDPPVEPGPSRTGADGLVPVRGVVVGPDGSPFRDAEVYVAGSDDAVILRADLRGYARSGEDGTFRFRMEPGRADLLVFAPGLLPAIVRDLEVTGETDAGTLRLEAGLALSGTVVDTDGAVVKGAVAVAWRDEAHLSNAFLPARLGLEQWGGTARTDERGEFRIEGLGKASLLLGARGLEIEMIAEPKEVSPGTDGHRIVVRRLRIATGLLQSEVDDRPVPSATVRLEIRTARQTSALISQPLASGRFVFDLTDSRYDDEAIRFTIYVSADGFEDSATENLRVADLRPDADLRIRLVPAAPVEPGRLRGRVLYDTGKPFYGQFTLSFSKEGQGGQVFRAKTDETGAFLIEGIPAGEYLLRSAARKSVVLKETGKRLVIPPGGEETTDFTFTRGGDLDVRVAVPGGEVPAGTTVEVLGAEGKAVQVEAVVKGRAVLLDLPPGPVRLRVTAQGHHAKMASATVEKDRILPVEVSLEEAR